MLSHVICTIAKNEHQSIILNEMLFQRAFTQLLHFHNICGHQVSDERVWLINKYIYILCLPITWFTTWAVVMFVNYNVGGPSLRQKYVIPPLYKILL